MPIQSFWHKVRRCKHKRLSDYNAHTHCANQSLGCEGGMESHCLTCGAFITECPCGYENGISGWSNRRWKDRVRWSPNA